MVCISGLGYEPLITALTGEVSQEINEVFLLHGTKPDTARASVIPDLIRPAIIDSLHNKQQLFFLQLLEILYRLNSMVTTVHVASSESGTLMPK